MHKYTVELTQPAEQTYLRIRDSATECLKKGDSSNPIVAIWTLLDDSLDQIIALDPFEKGTCLSPPLREVYWIARDKLRLYYVASPKPATVLVIAILYAPRSEEHRRVLNELLSQRPASVHPALGSRLPN
jgi:hypothetical protein